MLAQLSQKNGRHERMLRILKEDTAKPPARTLTAQQRKFDRFRLAFNHERPHESLPNETTVASTCPARCCYSAVWRASASEKVVRRCRF
jgi:hypothetical protein